jgi:hypothetical protein
MARIRKGTLREYLQKKNRKLSIAETQRIRSRIERGSGNVYDLAEKFGCVPTQIAGVKARLKF